MVMEHDSVSEGAAAIEYAIRLADHCMQLNNFADLVAVMAGLQHCSVHRLTQRWAAIKPSNQRTFQHLSEVLIHMMTSSSAKVTLLTDRER